MTTQYERKKVELICKYCNEIFYHENHFKMSCGKPECEEAKRRLKGQKIANSASKVSKEDKHKRIEKRNKTMINKYGVYNLMKTPEGKQRYSDLWKNKTKEEIDTIQEKIRNTCQEKFGVDNYAKTDEHKLRQKEIWENKPQEEKDEINNKKIQTSIELYGVEHPMKSPAVLEKRVQTNLEKYGEIHPLKTPEVKQHLRDSYKEKYGVDHPMKDKEICDKCHEKVKEFYDNKIYTKVCPVCNLEFTTTFDKHKKQKYCSDICKKESEKIRLRKIKETKKEIYGDENYTNIDKMKISWNNKTPEELEEIKQKHVKYYMDKYGVSCFSKTEEFKEKFKQICLDLYGVENVFQNEEIKQKIREANIEKYGVDHFMKTDEGKNVISEIYNSKSQEEKDAITEKVKETNLEKYGTVAPLQNEEIKSKVKKTCMNRYGVNNPMQCEEIFNKSIHNSKQWKNYILPSGKEIKIQGYEWIYLDEYFNEGKLEENIIIHPTQDIIGKIWYYTADGKKHKYYPDFYIPTENKIVEVKSTWTMKRDLEINSLKQKACIEAGYNFDLYVYDNRKNRILC